MNTNDIEHPPHYIFGCSEKTKHILLSLRIPEKLLSGECIEAIEYMSLLRYWGWGEFHMGNAIKYLWRCERKSDNILSDLKKAEWYIVRYCQILTKKKLGKDRSVLAALKQIQALIQENE
jgi:Protein of unknwon function (DUF3310)